MSVAYTSPFRGLPLEIRRLVWGHLLTSPPQDWTISSLDQNGGCTIQERTTGSYPSTTSSRTSDCEQPLPSNGLHATNTNLTASTPSMIYTTTRQIPNFQITFLISHTTHPQIRRLLGPPILNLLLTNTELQGEILETLFSHPALTLCFGDAENGSISQDLFEILALFRATFGAGVRKALRTLRLVGTALETLVEERVWEERPLCDGKERVLRVGAGAADGVMNGEGGFDAVDVGYHVSPNTDAMLDPDSKAAHALRNRLKAAFKQSWETFIAKSLQDEVSEATPCHAVDTLKTTFPGLRCFKVGLHVLESVPAYHIFEPYATADEDRTFELNESAVAVVELCSTLWKLSRTAREEHEGKGKGEKWSVRIEWQEDLPRWWEYYVQDSRWAFQIPIEGAFARELQGVFVGVLREAFGKVVEVV